MATILEGILGRMKLQELRHKHEGADVYVIGSGKTLEYYGPEVLDGQLTVGVNHGWSNVFESVDYMVTKYHELAFDWAGSPRVGAVVTTRGLRGGGGPKLEDPDGLFVADHNPNPVERFDRHCWPTDENSLVASHSSITTAMHFAAYVGARRIFVVAADCGTLDGAENVNGHPTGQGLKVFRSFDKQNQIVKAELEARYPVHVVGLLPFVTPNMTGHTFESYAGRLDAR